MSVITIFGHRTSFFGGGYLRLANKKTIKWGIDRLQADNHPLIVYVHPREIDPKHPRLPLPLIRQFKCYVNLSTTLPKLKWLCKNYSFCTMLKMVENYVRYFYIKNKLMPVTRAHNDQTASSDLHKSPLLTGASSCEALRSRLLMIEKAMANFLGSGVTHRA